MRLLRPRTAASTSRPMPRDGGSRRCRLRGGGARPAEMDPLGPVGGGSATRARRATRGTGAGGRGGTRGRASPPAGGTRRRIRDSARRHAVGSGLPPVLVARVPTRRSGGAGHRLPAPPQLPPPGGRTWGPRRRSPGRPGPVAPQRGPPRRQEPSRPRHFHLGTPRRASSRRKQRIPRTRPPARTSAWNPASLRERGTPGGRYSAGLMHEVSDVGRWGEPRPRTAPRRGDAAPPTPRPRPPPTPRDAAPAPRDATRFRY